MATLVQGLKKVVLRVTPQSLQPFLFKVTGPYVPGKLTYNQDGLSSRHACDFLQDPKFQQAYKLGEQTGSWRSWPIHWRLHILFWVAENVRRLEGDFVECGVNRGGFTRAIMDYIEFSKTGKTFWLCDTFEGDTLHTHIVALITIEATYAFQVLFSTNVAFSNSSKRESSGHIL